MSTASASVALLVQTEQYMCVSGGETTLTYLYSSNKAVPFSAQGNAS